MTTNYRESSLSSLLSLQTANSNIMDIQDKCTELLQIFNELVTAKKLADEQVQAFAQELNQQTNLANFYRQKCEKLEAENASSQKLVLTLQLCYQSQERKLTKEQQKLEKSEQSFKLLSAERDKLLEFKQATESGNRQLRDSRQDVQRMIQDDENYQRSSKPLKEPSPEKLQLSSQPKDSGTKQGKEIKPLQIKRQTGSSRKGKKCAKKSQRKQKLDTQKRSARKCRKTSRKRDSKNNREVTNLMKAANGVFFRNLPSTGKATTAEGSFAFNSKRNRKVSPCARKRNNDQDQGHTHPEHGKIKLMIQQGTFQCLCGMEFGSRSTLDRHVKLLTKGKPFECRWCPKRFLFASYLRNHFQATHKIIMEQELDSKRSGGAGAGSKKVTESVISSSRQIPETRSDTVKMDLRKPLQQIKVNDNHQETIHKEVTLDPHVEKHFEYYGCSCGHRFATRRSRTTHISMMSC